MSLNPPLQSLTRCFQGLVPSGIATCAPDGTPNVTFLSQVYYVDPTHVALSCQFFNKTRRNVEKNPHASVEVFDPMSLELYRLDVRYTHSETEGPLFEALALRIKAIASVTGMADVFKLKAADVYEVLNIEKVQGLLADVPLAPAQGTEFSLRHVLGVNVVSREVNRARDLDDMMAKLLRTLDEVCGMPHAMMMVPDESGKKLQALATRGYGEEGRKGIGAEVTVGEGLIGAVAEQRKVLRISDIEGELRYGRAIRQRVETVGGQVRPEIPLPGLPDAQSALALPLVVQDRLIGVLALESRDALAFGTWDEALLEILANQIAIAMDQNTAREEEEPAPAVAVVENALPPASKVRRFTFFRNDDCVFVDGEYLIRNVPGKILWKLLTAHQAGRTEWNNRELRLDPTLGLPAVKSNLESRLILLRRRLEQQCPEVRLVPTRRGHFALEICCQVDLQERDTA